MSARRRRKTGSWQIQRLADFARKEREESDLYEMYFEKIQQRIPFRVITVISFFQKENYTRKPGSLVALYRVSEGTGSPITDFLKRYEAYYLALERGGFW